MLNTIRRFFVNSNYAGRQDLAGRYFIVTGAAPGSLGFATAAILLEWGANVTITRRSASQQVAADLISQYPQAKDRIKAFDLDLASAESVASFIQAYIKNIGHLDVLINNAGIHLDLLSQWKSPKLSDDGYEIQWRTNYLGTFQLTQGLLPLLEKSAVEKRDARIVNVVSMLHSKGLNADLFATTRPYNSWNAYGQSKLALIHMTQYLQTHFAASGLQAYCLHPGAVYTNVASKGLAGNPKIEAVRNSLSALEKFFMFQPKEGAQTQIMCATQPQLKGGLYYRNCHPATASAETGQPDVAEKLWQQSLDWLKQTQNQIEPSTNA